MTSTAAPHPTGKDAANRALIGYGLILVSTVCFSINNNLAKESYQHGASVDTVLAARSWLLTVLLGVWFAVRGARPAVPAGMTGWLTLAVILFAFNAWALLSAFDEMSVSLAILIFYLFPFLVGLLSAALGIEPLRPVMIVGLIVAFAGLVLALDVGGRLNVWGVALALIAAIAIAVNILISGRLFRQGMTPTALSFWVMLGGAAVFTALMFFSGGPKFPAGATGWAAFAGTAIFVGIAFITFYAALTCLSESRTALVMNLEPVFTIVIAVLLFGEAFGLSQWIGAALVITAIVGVTAAGRRR